MTWGTVHEHVLADAFCCKKSSSVLLVDGQQTSQKKYLWIAIQLLVVKKKQNIYVNTNRMCKAPNYSKMNHKCLYLSTALLLALNIKNYRCKLVERNKCRDMGNCSLTPFSRRVFLQEELVIPTSLWTASITKEMRSESHSTACH